MTRRDARTVNDEIDSNLKRAFAEVAEEPVPDHLLKLLDRLRSQDADTADGDPPKDPPDRNDTA
ncbi:NepR family anti-sigma factor [uncultured Tateyamaria sp.]|uniref:NepR family anti-sigma factor n=1 Tax=uncultured Tateyamaria sp. TaxID=455651 RepID=UPI00263A3A2E|nr:NepR family anti-sigma factor [uncultured Tateyamaria sp.]